MVREIGGGRREGKTLKGWSLEGRKRSTKKVNDTHVWEDRSRGKRNTLSVDMNLMKNRRGIIIKWRYLR